MVLRDSPKIQTIEIFNQMWSEQDDLALNVKYRYTKSLDNILVKPTQHLLGSQQIRICVGADGSHVEWMVALVLEGPLSFENL